MLRIATLALLLLASGPGAETLADLPRPDGQIVLTVTGAIARANHDGAAEFDMDMLHAINPTLVLTTTPWTDGPQEFEGVLLQDLLNVLGVHGGTAHAQAVNDYGAEIPLDGPDLQAALIAYRQNGADLPARGKGPLWLVYPYDSTPEFQSEVIYARSIWQLDRLEVRAPDSGQ